MAGTFLYVVAKQGQAVLTSDMADLFLLAVAAPGKKLHRTSECDGAGTIASFGNLTGSTMPKLPASPSSGANALLAGSLGITTNI